MGNLAEIKKNELSVNDAAWGSEEISSNDLILPKILVMQGLSEMVTEGDAKMGEFRSSLDGKLLGSEKMPVAFVPFNTQKTWLEYRDGKYFRTIEMTPENESLPFEEMDGESVIKRDKSLDFYVLLQSDLNVGEAFPYVISFRKTSHRSGKKLATLLAQLRMFKKPAASHVFLLSATRETNDKGTFMVLDVTKGEPTNPEVLATAYEWYTALKSMKAKVHETEAAVEEDKSEEIPIETTSRPKKKAREDDLVI